MKKIFLIFTILIVLLYVFSLGRNTSEKTVNVLPKTPSVKQVVSPKNLIISKLNINTEIEFVGLDSKGRMDVPVNAQNVAWYNLGALPSQRGSAVLAGHLDDENGDPAVFYNLDDLVIGDLITIVDINGDEKQFKVEKVEVYEHDKFPLQEVFADESGKFLNLITCNGTWDNENSNYSERLVVYSRLVE